MLESAATSGRFDTGGSVGGSISVVVVRIVALRVDVVVEGWRWGGGCQADWDRTLYGGGLAGCGSAAGRCGC